MKKSIKIVILVICIVTLLYSGNGLYKWAIDKNNSDNVTMDINDISKGEKIEKDSKPKEEPDRFDYGINFDNLKETNKDTYGWIRNKDYINYPVVTSKDGGDYLNTDFNGLPSSSGTIFTLDKTNYNDDNISLYGHVMGIYRTDMFSTIHSYREPDYFKDFNEMQFITPESVRDFEIISMFEIDIVEDEFDPFVSNFNTPEESKSFYDNIYDRSEVVVKHNYNEDNKYLTLMTCLRGGRETHERLVTVLIEK